MPTTLTQVDPKLAIGFKNEPIPVKFTWVDACVYALSIGMNVDPLNQTELKYTYEQHKNFQVFPTASSLTRTFNIFTFVHSCPGIPEFNDMALLHGQEKTEIIRPLIPNRNYISQGEMVDVADKKSGALLTLRILTYHDLNSQFGEVYRVTTMSVFVRGLGGFGYKGTLKSGIPKIPKSTPTFTIEDKTNDNQALFFRLCGDANPLHAEPEQADVAGFEKPILHGLCSYGISAKLIVKQMAGYDARKLKMLNARFTSHVYPGETLVMDGWVEGNTVVFALKTKERGKTVIVGTALLAGGAKL